MNFVAELKRRNVFKVAAAYSAVAWMFLELSALALNAFSAPAWVMKVVIFFAVAGFAVAVLLAWAFELTPEGIRRTNVSAETPATPVPSSGKLTTITITALALALVLVVLDSYVLRDAPAVGESAGGVSPATEEAAVTAEVAAPASTPADEKSLAILPFTMVSSEADQQYFADGLTDELINVLASVDNLRVTGRTSAFYFKDSALPLEEIADMLSVTNILQGSVRKSGADLRITVQLTATDTSFSLWSQTYERKLDDIFVLQDEIATEVATALSVTLGAGDFAEPGMTRNVAAYDAYLRGRAGYEARSQESLLEAIVHLENAVRLDPDFALAWYYLGRDHGLAQNMLPAEQTAGFAARADEALAKALALAPEMRILTRLRVDTLYDAKDFVGVEQALQEDGARYGVDATSNLSLAAHLLQVGRAREALVYAQRAKRQDPYSASAAQTAAAVLAANGQLVEARQEIARGLMLVEADADFYYLLSLLEMDAQDWTAAVEATSHLSATREVQTRVLNDLIAGGTADTVDYVRDLFAEPGTAAPVVIYYGLPVYAAVLDQPELALEILDALGLIGNTRAVLSASFFDDTRRLPGFKTLMEKEGLLNYWRTTGNWADYCRPVNDDFECF